MKENNLLASVALFGELYNTERYNNVGDIIAEFIKGAVIAENRWSVNSLELRELIKKIYDFDLLESVLKTTINTKLGDVCSKKDGIYHFDPAIAKSFEIINQEYQTISKVQQSIFAALINYIEEVEQKTLTIKEKEEVNKNFHQYLMNNNVTEKYLTLISGFVIKNQLNNEFTDNLNLIKEGVILYEGIRYTAKFGDFNELGNWTNTLTIYLSSEYLFSAVGFNGALYQDIFSDFSRLISEVNYAQKEKKIQLKFLEETKDEIDRFFKTAESIKKGYLSLDPSKTAMKSILEGCIHASDVVLKKIQFEKDLKSMGISLETNSYDVTKNVQYNLEDESLLQELKLTTEAAGRIFDENVCRMLFKIFSKINYFRRGVSNVSFQKIGFIFLTSNNFALHLAHNTKVKFESKDQSFAKDIDYVTNMLWFKLKKGFGGADTPKSFDVITKAQIILSAQLNNTILHQYQKLVKDNHDGKLSRDEALQRSFELREKPNKPEDITFENIDQSIDFLNNDEFFEDLAREREKQSMMFKDLERERQELKDELARRDALARRIEIESKAKEYEQSKLAFIEEKRKHKLKSDRKDLIYITLIFLVTIMPAVIGIFLKSYKPLSDLMNSLTTTWQSIIWISLTLIFAGELFARTYIFNRSRMTNGWIFLTLLAKRKNYNEKRLMEHEEFEKLYVSEKPFLFQDFIDNKDLENKENI